MAATKTPHTPNFYGSFSSLDGAKTENNPTAYLDHLSRTYIALTQVKELPPSRPGSPVIFDENYGEFHQSSAARISGLRKQVTEAYGAAKGNPSDGKWSQLSQLLRMNVTSGRYRWIGTRNDYKVPEPGIEGWINAASEEEWLEWEKKRDSVKNKGKEPAAVDLPAQVDAIGENFGLLPVDPNIDTTKSAENPTTATVAELVKVQSNVLKDGAPFGFRVVKRTVKSKVGKSKPSKAPSGPIVSKPTNAAHGSKTNDSKRDTDASVSKPKSKTITVLPENSFFPPSFPSSQVVTSTPVAKPNVERHKPEPIGFPISSPTSPLVESPPPPSSSLKPSSSLSIVPITSTPEGLSLYSPQIGEKRSQPPHTPIRGLKKARTLPSISPNPFSTTNEGIITPIISPLQSPNANNLSSAMLITPERKALPTLTELLASSKKAKHKSPKDQQNIIEKVPIYELLDSDKLPVYDIHTPARSLSSLADSSSEASNSPGALDHDFSLDHDNFLPRFASTQFQLGSPTGALKPSSGLKGPGGTHSGVNGLGWNGGGYSSQFDVDRQVDQVDKLLERDVDYDGWLRDPSLEPGPS